MEIVTPNGEIVVTKLAAWQIRFCYYMSLHSALGRARPLQRLLELEEDDSLFNGIVARTFKDAFNVGEQMGYQRCLEELCGREQ
jgi:hypothetical protein